MKFAFSTLGCPEWSWSDIVSTAKDFGFDGVEIRGVLNELYAPTIKQFSKDNIQKTKEELKRLKLDISCLTTACYLFDKNKQTEVIKEGKEYIDLAKELNVPYIRLLGDQNPQPKDNIDDDVVIKGTVAIAEYASDKGVTVLIETNGVYADSKRLLALLEKINMNNVGVLWDIHHPYRFYGETPKETYDLLGKYIKYVHVKDSIENKDGTISYKIMGAGDLPIKNAISILANNSYDGYISLEWVKRWYSDLEAPGIVFMQFIDYMKSII